MSDKVIFNQVGEMQTPFGTLRMGDTGIVLFEAIDCHTGEMATVVLCHGHKDTTAMSSALQLIANSITTVDKEPCGLSFSQLMDNINKH